MSNVFVKNLSSWGKFLWRNYQWSSKFLSPLKRDVICTSSTVNKEIWGNTIHFNYSFQLCSYTKPEQNKVNLVLSSIRATKKKEKVTAELQLHSDQGFQYTSHPYFKLTQFYNIIPSMSSKGNPYDNALAENFFSILKSECINRVKLKTYEEARLLIDEYIHFYNTERIQTKTKLTPLEKRSQFVA